MQRSLKSHKQIVRRQVQAGNGSGDVEKVVKRGEQKIPKRDCEVDYRIKACLGKGIGAKVHSRTLKNCIKDR